MSSVTFLYPWKRLTNVGFLMFGGGGGEHKNVTLDINGLKEQPLKVVLENRCSEKYVLKIIQVYLWSKYFQNTFEGAQGLLQ